MNPAEAIVLAVFSVPGALVLLSFWWDIRDCQTCPKASGGHEWEPPWPTLAGWSVVKCGRCGREDIT